MPRTRRHRDNVPAARRLRREMTASERLLWDLLRDRRFHGLKFRRQHPVGPFVLDFYCAALRLAIEVDDAVHDRPPQAARDRERQQILEERGIRVVRLRVREVEADLRAALEALTPSPSPAGRGEASAASRGEGLPPTGRGEASAPHPQPLSRFGRGEASVASGGEGPPG